MSTNWNPENEEPEVWKTSPAESSYPSFPFIDRDVPPAVPEGYVIPSPPPPPSNILDPATGQNERPTTPLVGATFAGVGVIFGVVMTLAVLLGLLWINGWIPHALGLDGQVGRTASTSPGSNFGKSTGSSNPPGGSGSTTTTGGGGHTHTPSPGATATSAATPAAVGTATPGPTATPSPLPLTVTAIAHDHKTATMTITTRAGTTLIITVTYCDGSTDSKYNDFSTVTTTGTYTDTLTLVKCTGQGAYEGTIAVAAHLSGFQDAMANTQILAGG
jgi:hypothetical protein